MSGYEQFPFRRQRYYARKTAGHNLKNIITINVEGDEKKMQDNYMTAPSKTTKHKIGNREYLVTSYFAGSKNISKVLSDLAERQAYADIFGID